MKILLFCIIVSLISTLSAEIRQSSHKNIVPGQYIIKLKNGLQSESFVNSHSLPKTDGVLAPLKENVKFLYDTALNGFSAQLDETQLQLLDSLPEVEFIENDRIVNVQDFETQTGSPWGLARTSTRNRLNFDDSSYNYIYDSTGNGVTVYVLDTGVRIEHVDFGGRASYGFNAVSSETDEDIQSHGTHVAGTIAGTVYGIAKKALIVSVKVCDRFGECLISDIIAGINWVINRAKPGSVINMSLGDPVSNETTSEEIAIQNAVVKGITTVVAAGNSRMNACFYSPARAKAAITVAASDVNDTAATFTNYGECVDVFAPGVRILSAGNQSNTAEAIKSGTSMAAPHVAGLAAYLISKFNLSEPAQVKDKIISLSTMGAIYGVDNNTPNKIIFNDWSNSANGFKFNTINIIFLGITFAMIAKKIY